LLVELEIYLSFKFHLIKTKALSH